MAQTTTDTRFPFHFTAVEGPWVRGGEVGNEYEYPAGMDNSEYGGYFEGYLAFVPTVGMSLSDDGGVMWTVCEVVATVVSRPTANDYAFTLIVQRQELRTLA